MGLPAYPPDWATTMKQVQRGLRQAMTGAQTRVRYVAIRARSLILGPEQGARIEIDPTGGPGGAPSLTFRPQTGSKVGVMTATSDAYPDEVTITIKGGTNNRGTVYTEVTLGGGIVRAAVRDASSGEIRRNLDITEDYASIGTPSSSGKAYARLDDNGVVVQAPPGGDVNVQGNGGRITLGSDGGIALVTADNGAFLEMSPGANGGVNKNW